MNSVNPIEEKKPNRFLSLLRRFLKFLGFSRHSDYAREFLNNANIRSGVFMAMIVIAIEIWMIIRRLIDTVIPQAQSGTNFFVSLWKNTSNFWLLLAVGLGMIAYCIAFLDAKAKRWKAVAAVICGALCLVFSALLPLETFRGNGNVRDVLLVTFYVSVILFGLAVIFASLWLEKKGKDALFAPMMVISTFALVCLVFGIKVSFADFFSSSDVKQVICFLMMTLYVGCLLIWRPFASIGILGASFLIFYFLLINFEGVERTHRHLPDGDVVNYITFFISLTMVCFSIYHQRMQEATKEQKLHELATTDSLTGLSSFDYFLSSVEGAIAADPEILKTHTHLFVDIDGFSAYNDQRGFNQGNQYLIRVGALLRKYFPNGFVSRQGEDHFSLFVPTADIASFYENINADVASLDPSLPLSISVGSYTQNSPSENIRRAVDKARYAAALAINSPNISHEYGQAEHDAYHLRQYVIRNVDRACEEEWAKVYYQPIVDAKTGKVVEFEALSRWNDPKRGFLSPASFIPALEGAKLIHKLDAHVFRTACRDYARRLKEHGVAVPISINISRADFDYMDVSAVLREAREAYGVPAEAIHVEITESALTEDEDKISAFLNGIHSEGYPLWLDDFGSGYSSFNVLKDFPFDVLKIDMRFLEGFGTNPKCKLILRHIIGMAKHLGMESLCEGVETKEQAEFLAKEGCDKLQGYLFGKAAPYEEAEKPLGSVSVD